MVPDEPEISRTSLPLFEKIMKNIWRLSRRPQEFLIGNSRWRRLLRDKGQLEGVDDPIDRLLVKDKGDDLHRPP
jgi:hypothetical protein